MKSLNEIYNTWLLSLDYQCGVRFGQYFCNKYIKDSWPKLFYEEDNEQSKKLIVEWLVHHCYTTSLPTEVIQNAVSNGKS